MPPIPEQLGRYRVDKLLGEGGMGAVYLATDGSLGRKVALKIPHVGGSDAAQTVERFLREARLAATLNHPNICPVYDVGEIDGKPYLTMRYVEGRPLSRYINPERLQNPRSVALIVRKLADALQHAHEHGVVHRDLKPANILVDAKNEPIVMDFGLARELGGANEKRVTQSGMIVGTPAYMSPEQVALESDQVDARTDIWSLGVIFFEMLTGRLPYDGTVLQILGALQHVEPPQARDVLPTAPEPLSAICRKMMTRDRDQRHQTMRDVAEDLTAWIQDPTRSMAGTVAIPELASVTTTRPNASPENNPTLGTPFDFASLSIERPATVTPELGMSESGTTASGTTGLPTSLLTHLDRSRSPTPGGAITQRKPRPSLPPWALPGAASALTLVVILVIVVVSFRGNATRPSAKAERETRDNGDAKNGPQDPTRSDRSARASPKSGAPQSEFAANGDLGESPQLPAAVRQSLPDVRLKETFGPEDGWIDLLAWGRHTKLRSQVNGNERSWAFDGNSLRLMENPGLSSFVLPAILRGDYELEVEFTKGRDTHGKEVDIAFPVADQSVIALLGSWGGSVDTLGTIDRIPADRSQYAKRPSLIQDYDRHRVVIVAKSNRETAEFEIALDGSARRWAWKGSPGSLGVDHGGWRLPTVECPAIGSFDSTVTFHTARVRMLSGELSRAFRTQDDARRDLRQGLTRVIDLKPRSARVNWGEVRANRIQADVFPWVTPEIRWCDDYWFAHAPSTLKCAVPQGARSFSTIGYCLASGDVEFKISIDGQVAYRSGRTAFCIAKIPVPSNARELRLEVDPLANNTHDRSFWCHPRFHAVPVDKLDDDHLDNDVPKSLRSALIPVTSGHGQITHNGIVAALAPLHWQSVKPCHEFLFAHGASELVYDIPEGMMRFTAVGWCPRSESVKYAVVADGQVLYESPQAGIVDMNVKLPKGAKTLALVVDDLGKFDHDHSFWCFPRLHRE